MSRLESSFMFIMVEVDNCNLRLTSHMYVLYPGDVDGWSPFSLFAGCVSLPLATC